MTAANIVGVDPHRKTFTATLLDPRGGEIDHAHFINNRDGHALRWCGRPSSVRSSGGASKAPAGSAGRSPSCSSQPAETCARFHRTRHRCVNAAATKVSLTGSTRIASRLRRKPTCVSPGRSSTPSRRSQTRFETGSPYGTTLAPRCERSASSSSVKSTHSSTTSPKNSGHSCRPRRPSELASPHSAARHLGGDRADRAVATQADRAPGRDAARRPRARPDRRPRTRRARRRDQVDAHRPGRDRATGSSRDHRRGRRHPTLQPRPASPASTAPHPSRPAPPKATANPSDTGSVEAATDDSTPRSTASPSPSSATNHAPARSTTTPAPTATPAEKRCASSSETCPTPSTEPWPETPDNPPA
jgi:hypothetical protein